MTPERSPIVHRTRPAAGTSEGALVLMHGRGADELDLMPLLDLLDPEQRLVGLMPRGPLALPPGGVVSRATGGDQRAAIVMVGLFFLVGLALLARVRAGGPTSSLLPRS